MVAGSYDLPVRWVCLVSLPASVVREPFTKLRVQKMECTDKHRFLPTITALEFVPKESSQLRIERESRAILLPTKWWHRPQIFKTSLCAHNIPHR